MIDSHINLYVVHSAEELSVHQNSFLVPTYSPMQNYSELYVQRAILNQGVLSSSTVGFFHMRRYLDLSSRLYHQDDLSRKTRPYRFQKFPEDDGYSGDSLRQKLLGYDIIAPIPERTGVTVQSRYGQYPNHRSVDLERVVEILLEKHPEYRQAASDYLAGTQEYYGNLYIMSGKYFTEYATWLFDILSEFDSRVTDQLPRTPGYLSERLFGIWLTQKLEEGDTRIGFAPRVHFYGYDGTTHHFRRDMVISMLLPPGSKRRFWLREVMRRGTP